MALIQCKECGQMISDKAMKCPKCGCPIQEEGRQYQEHAAPNAPVYYEKKNNNQKWLYGIIAVLAIAVGCVIFYLLSKEGKTGEETPDMEAQKVENTNESIMEVVETETADEADVSDSKPIQEVAANDAQIQQGGINCTLVGEISTIQDVKMVLRGHQGTLTYVMDGKRIVSNIVLDDKASNIDEDGFGHLVLKSFTPNGKLKGRFIGEMDPAECGYFYKGEFVNVNGGSTTFFLHE